MTEEVTGIVERMTFASEETGFAVAKILVQRQLLTCIGAIAELQVGESVLLRGTYKHHPQHGTQFQVDTYKCVLPADLLGIEKYLGSGLIKGIGPKKAQAIVAAFGKETLDIIDEAPERLTEVAGIGAKQAATIHATWQEQRSVRDVMIFLQGHGVSATYAQRIYRFYGNDAIKKVQANPYVLAADINGIGFLSADKIAKALGFAHTSEERIQAGILHALNELASDGHVCYPEADFAKAASSLLTVEEDLITAQLPPLIEGRHIVLASLSDKPFLWLKPLYLCEAGIATQVRRLLAGKSHLSAIDEEKALEWSQKTLGLQLATQQKEAVRAALSEKLLIITGGPGTGKSTITKAILAILSKVTQRILLCAPTGRAAKRMSEICLRQASTIHSLLKYDFKKGGFRHNQQNPLDCDLVIIDEASMIDTHLMYSLLKAIPATSRVIFVGDVDQLPSVGPGKVLKDMIASEAICTKALNQIFRQAKGSEIISSAHAINHGRFPKTDNEKDSDFFFMEAAEPEEVLSTILSLVAHRLPKKYAFNPLTDIQVLTPMYRGPIGANAINQALQQALNPATDSNKGISHYRIGDKVMQLRNDYQKEVYNGDMGLIIDCDHEERTILVDFDGKSVPYTASELDSLCLAYAVSVHKYQGSECPCVIMPVHTSHYILLNRNILYTGVTRGKKLVVLVGTKKALFLGIQSHQEKERFTGLKEALG